MHPAVKKYLSEKNSRVAKARWAKVSPKRRSNFMKKVRAGGKKTEEKKAE